jgi:transposase
MSPASLLPHLAGFRFLDIASDSERLVIDLVPRGRTARCPRCSRRSRHIHSHYVRSLRDLPCGGHPVILCVHVRRFRCRNRHCSRQIFCERLPTLVEHRKRQSLPLIQALTEIGFALGGEAGSRLATFLQMPGSPASLLRLVRQCVEREDPRVRVLGVDDWAKRKGRSYGTILVDLERHCPIDLLPDATSEGLVTWLELHHEIEIISRDRGKEYAEGARQGAPDAIQVADRWHLLKNLSDVLETLFTHRSSWLRDGAAPHTGDADAMDDQKMVGEDDQSAAQQEVTARRERRVQRYEQVKALQAGGMSLSEIARTLQIARRTVLKYARADRFPERAPRRPGPASLQSHDTYLRDRWNAGCHNGSQLWRELRDQGYHGSAKTVLRYLYRWRTNTDHHLRCRADHSVTPRHASWICTQPIDSLGDKEKRELQLLRAVSSDVETVYTLAQEFRRMVREQDRTALEGWLGQAVDSSVSELQGFAAHLKRDRKAVEAALTLPWSQGQTEGQINRLKLLKRQMYGRANIDLLRLRVLHRAA